jgi:hypothetical protein
MWYLPPVTKHFPRGKLQVAENAPSGVWLVATGFLKPNEKDTLRRSTKWCQHQLWITEIIFCAIIPLLFGQRHHFQTITSRNISEVEVSLKLPLILVNHPLTGLKAIFKSNFENVLDWRIQTSIFTSPNKKVLKAYRFAHFHTVKAVGQKPSNLFGI